MKMLAEEVEAQLDAVRNLYYRLVLLVGPAGTGKTSTLLTICEQQRIPYVNLNLALSQRLLDYPSKARPLRVRGALDDIITSVEGDRVALDNIEILFDPTLKQDPLRLLQLVSRNRTVVASWNGDTAGRTLTYAAAGHPEHRRYPDVDTILVRAGRNSDAGAGEGDAR